MASVITINDGTVWADSNEGMEGDGIDSNGWLVINGGSVNAFGNSDSMDSGLDSDKGVYINGGTVFATGNMYDEISKGSSQNFAVFNFAQPVYDKSVVLKSLVDDSLTLLKGNAKGSVMVYSSPQLAEGDYELYFVNGYTGGGEVGVFTDITAITDEIQLAHSGTSGGMMGGRPQMGGFDRKMPQNGDRFGMPSSWNDGNRPIPDRGTPPQNTENMPAIDFDKQRPQGDMPQAMPTPDGENMPMDFGVMGNATETIFNIVKGANIFNGVTELIIE